MKKSEHRTAKFRNDSRSTDELIQLILARDPDADDDGYWNLIFVLQHRLPEILTLVHEMTEDSDERVRDLAVTVLGQSGVEKKLMVDRSAAVLIGRLTKETSLLVLESAVFSLGHLADSRKIVPLAALADHASPDIRYALAHSLAGSDDPLAIGTLIRLSGDSDEEVRNWATFGLGSQTKADTPEIRDALAARLDEANGEVRMEAVVGLTERGDVRAIPVLFREFDSPDSGGEHEEGLVLDALDAAVARVVATGDKAWLPVIKKALKVGLGDPELLMEAVDRCKGGSASTE